MQLKSLHFFIFFLLIFGLSSCREFTSNAVKLMASGDSATLVFPAPLGSVSDFEKILTTEQIRSLDSIIIQHEQRTDNKISIVIVKSIKPYNSLSEYSSDLLDNWENGENHKQSVLISFSEKMKEAEIITGSSLRKKLSEKESKRIIHKTMEAEFENGDY
ncbi:MAG: TPM domain-containing protein, partial [Porphyromonadaceae bacterium]|nr:TPM domain-containing protein [Porphyromonadaceae bacterium]